MRGCAERTDRVRWDLISIIASIAQGNLDAARRFRASAEKTFPQIADMPGMGEPCDFDDPSVPPTRRCLISGFRHYLVYHTEIRGGVRILRVVHTARDPGDLPDLEEIR